MDTLSALFMTPDEARACVFAIQQQAGELRRLLYDLYVRRGWEALGYNSWRECVLAEFTYSEGALYHILKAAQIEANISSRDEIGKIPERHLRPMETVEDPQQQREVWQMAVESAADGKLTFRHVQAAVKAVEREQIKIQRESQSEPTPVITPPLPDGKYRCIVIDPPWPMEKIDRDVRPKQSHYLDYPIMSLEDIAALPVGDFASDDGCHLYLWVTQKFLPAGLDLLTAWGFQYQCVLTWVKPTGITPYSWMYNSEHVLFGTCGGLRLQQMGLKLTFEAPAVGHSVKPDVFYARVALASPEPRLEMFARDLREGFEVWGNEV